MAKATKKRVVPKHRQAAVTAATLRQVDRNELTAQEQLKVLDERLGSGVGATKERARLRKAAKAAKVAEAAEAAKAAKVAKVA